MAAVRRFIREHEEPCPALDEAVSHERLMELYPLLASDADFSVQRVGGPKKPDPEELQRNPRSRTALLHVLEKVPRRKQRGGLKLIASAMQHCMPCDAWKLLSTPSTTAVNAAAATK